MAVTTLDPAQAFTSGCELWVAPMANNSTLSGAIDWYINGQMTKALSHHPKALEPALNEILRANDLNLSVPPVRDGAAILIATQGQLPARWLMLVDFSAPAKDWARRLAESAQGLKIRTIRMFADADFSFGEFDKSWNQFGRNMDLQIIRN